MQMMTQEPYFEVRKYVFSVVTELEVFTNEVSARDRFCTLVAQGYQASIVKCSPVAYSGVDR